MRTFHENVRVDVLVDPAALGTTISSYLDMVDYDRCVFLMAIGATDNTLDLKVVQATDSSGTSVKDITNAAITQLTGSDDNEYVSVEVDQTALDIANSFTHVAAQPTAAGTTTGVIIAMRYHAGSMPVTQPAAYSEQVTVVG